MKLTLSGLQDREAFANAGISLPSYDVKQVVCETKKNPGWVHFGIGNIFRIFIGGIADQLLSDGDMQRGITCVETFDFEVVDKIYKPYDNLALAVTLYGNGTSDKKVIGALSEAIAARKEDASARTRLKEVFTAPTLQMVTFTITRRDMHCGMRPANGSASCRRISKTDRLLSAV